MALEPPGTGHEAAGQPATLPPRPAAAAASAATSRPARPTPMTPGYCHYPGHRRRPAPVEPLWRDTGRRRDHRPGEGPMRGMVHGCLPALLCLAAIVAVIAAAVWAVS